jgi:two component transcriptional regulator
LPCLPLVRSPETLRWFIWHLHFIYVSYIIVLALREENEVIRMAQILLVEDNAAAAALICQYMKALYSDHQITICATATDAFDWAGKHHIDLFILDIQLPDYRGTELGKYIRAMPEYRFTPILFTTELGGEGLAAYREIKCYDFLIKPFTQEQFLRAVSTALDMGQQMKKPEPILRIEQKQFLFEYELKQIRYIESFGKRLVIHSISQGEDLADQISGYSLMRLLELAGKDNLIQCHKSFLINPVFIKKIDKGAKELWLKDCKETIPIGEKYQHNLRERAL